MINSLFGRITAKQDSLLCLQCGPVEWALHASQSTIAELPDVGAQCKVFTYVHHREDQLYMVAFSDEQQRQIFLDLISVGGIGPKQSLRILSGLPSALLVEAIKTDDVTTLSKVPGMGKKTAQKVILSLKGRLIDLSEDDKKSDDKNYDIVEALVQMGYERQQVTQAVDQAASREGIEQMAEDKREAYLMREAIRLMS